MFAQKIFYFRHIELVIANLSYQILIRALITIKMYFAEKFIVLRVEYVRLLDLMGLWWNIRLFKGKGGSLR